MPLFDLGQDLKVTTTVQADLQGAFALSKQILEGYKRLGFQVRFLREVAPSDISAQVTNTDGTRIDAEVRARAAGAKASRVEVQLRGKVHVGGLKGALASDAKVQEVAGQMLKDEIKKALKSHGLAGALQALAQREQVYACCQQKAAQQTQRA